MSTILEQFSELPLTWEIKTIKTHSGKEQTVQEAPVGKGHPFWTLWHSPGAKDILRKAGITAFPDDNKNWRVQVREDSLAPKGSTTVVGSDTIKNITASASLKPEAHATPEGNPNPEGGVVPASEVSMTKEFKKKSKSSTLAFFLLTAIPSFHYFYLGKVWINLFFWATVGGFGLWWFIDLFRVFGMVREYNKTVAINVLRDIQILN